MKNDDDGQIFCIAVRWNGMGHIDLRYDERERQIKLLDFNPDWDTYVLGALTAGVNFPYLACLTALDIPFSRPDYFSKRFIRGKAALKQGIQKYFGENTVGS